jgi:hypothetical protein
MQMAIFMLIMSAFLYMLYRFLKSSAGRKDTSTLFLDNEQVKNNQFSISEEDVDLEVIDTEGKEKKEQEESVFVVEGDKGKIQLTDKNIIKYVNSLLADRKNVSEVIEMFGQNPVWGNIPMILLETTPEEILLKIDALSKLYKVMVDNLWLLYFRNDISYLLKEGLRNHAKNNCYVTRLFIPSTPLHDNRLHISQSYVNLAIISGQDDKKVDENKEAADDLSVAYQNERQQSYESLYKEKKPVEIVTIFDNSEHRHHLIIGAPGVGKTTLCQHLFYRCVQNDGLWADKFEAVFWIPLRKLKGDVPPNNPAKLLAFVVCKYGLSGTVQDSVDLKQLQLFINSNNEKILWILDGYDEVMLEANQEGSLVNVFLNKLNSYGENGPAIIMTSRPQTQYLVGGRQLTFDCVFENI